MFLKSVKIKVCPRETKIVNTHCNCVRWIGLPLLGRHWILFGTHLTVRRVCEEVLPRDLIVHSKLDKEPALVKFKIYSTHFILKLTF